MKELETLYNRTLKRGDIYGLLLIKEVAERVELLEAENLRLKQDKKEGDSK